MEEILLRRAEAGDALLLTELRKTVLIAANRLPEDADLSAIEEPCRLYFADTRRQTTYLAFCAEEIAGVVSLLCSPDSSYVTGQIIEISGGLSM